ncbi:hypothetical protein [Pseudonocardia xinjiangensis]|uniref:Uncharacterized protein n=1 Tax=Pseudonocardia xinjiangensis TaxID=75289 RepID=A0ABX1RBV3_9PSEU|nr:hypothetical protein [Pseudonocardia xinjiangensis]NMH77847.1 hypothetical protein [Pseudonocardia xinjiangensis]
MQSALLEEPLRCGDTAVSSALVELAAVPPHDPLPPEQSTRAPAFETLTGPETCEPDAPAAGSRSSTVVSLPAEQVPPAPCAEHEAEPELSRTPVMSPDAEPVVADFAVPVHAALPQSTSEPAVLVAASFTGLTVAAAATSFHASRPLSVRAAAFDVESAEQPPAVAVQDEEPLVVRTAAVSPVPLETVAFVVVVPVPEQPAAPSHPIRVSARAVPVDPPLP